MERRKDTPTRGEKLPRQYLDLITDVFRKNFSDKMKGRGKNREAFVIFGEIYPDEVLMAVSLKNPANMRMITCYASIDYPPAMTIPESGQAAQTMASAHVSVETAVNACIDVVASFFQTYFDEGRPVDYDAEYRQDWLPVDLDKTTRIHIRLNRDNLELEDASDTFLAQHEAMAEQASEQREPDRVQEAMQSLVEEVEEEAEEENEEGEHVSPESAESEDSEESTEGDEPKGRRRKNVVH